MTDTSTPPQSATDDITRSLSSLSITSSIKSEDWDKSTSSCVTPSTPQTTLSPEVEETPRGNTGKTPKSLAELLKIHASGRKKELNLTEEEEKRLSEELASWINSDSSPYELNDAYDFDAQEPEGASTPLRTEAETVAQTTGHAQGT